jgi:F-type H+-transporting ATPase subunit a
MPILASGFLWGDFIAGITESNIFIFHGLVVTLILCSLAVFYRLSLKSVEEEILPDGRVSLKNIVQSSVQSLNNLVAGCVHHHPEQYTPFLGSVFLYIFIANLMGLMPGFLPPTQSMQANLAVALCVFVFYHAVGIKTVGVKKYLAHFVGPIALLGVIMVPIEIISHFIRPIALSLRLFGNIFGDHKVIEAISSLIPVVLPVVFMAFGIFVSFMQAYVFTLLSTVYVGLAADEGH